jgi:serine acetyltransferase
VVPPGQRCRAGDTGLPRTLERLLDRSYRMTSEWIMGIDLHPEVQAGPGLTIFHCHNVVLHPQARLGAGCVLRAGVCLGTTRRADGLDSAAPVLGDRVDVGVGALVVGPLRVGDGARIGAGAVVLRDVPHGATAVGNPARVIEPAQLLAV